MRMFIKTNISVKILWLLLFSNTVVCAQSPWERLAKKTSTLGLDKGIDSFRTASFVLKLVRASQTVAALQPVSEKGFDFTPGDSLQIRSSNGMYHLGDINL